LTNEISQKDIESGIRQGELVLVEALPEPHWKKGHLPGALNLPLEGLANRAAEILPDRDANIVVYCSGPSCQNSHIAKRKLSDLGYSRVRVFGGGKSAWTDAGHALEVSP
jgi:rhodanese-related sulfurtransferase